MSAEPDRQSAIERRMSPVQRGNTGKLLGLIIIGLILVIGLIWLSFPDELRNVLFRNTSTSDEMQTVATDYDQGISTDVPFPEAEPSTAPQTEPAEEGLTEAELDRLARIEEELAALAAREGGMSQAEMDTLLQTNLNALREEMRRMMLAQRPVAAGVDPSAADDAEARARMDAERERLAAIETAQIGSNGLVYDGGTVPGGGEGGGGAPAGSRGMTGDEEFLASASSRSYQTARAGRIGNPSRMLVQGTILDGVLETALNTELPGAARALLSVDVYSYDGMNVLLPRGTRLIGTYNSDVSIAQRRAQVVWNRAITPDGTTVEIGGIGSDRLGRSGQTGHVNTRFWQRFGSAALISLVGTAPNVLIDENTDSDVADAIEDLGDDFSDSTRTAFDEYLRLAPVISVHQGDRITIFVNRDLMF